MEVKIKSNAMNAMINRENPSTIQVRMVLAIALKKATIKARKYRRKTKEDRQENKEKIIDSLVNELEIDPLKTEKWASAILNGQRPKEEDNVHGRD